MGSHTFVLPQYQKGGWSPKAIEIPLMTERKQVPRDMLVEWNQNTLIITARSLGIPMAQVSMTDYGLVAPRPITCTMGNWTVRVCTKPHLTLTH